MTSVLQQVFSGYFQKGNWETHRTETVAYRMEVYKNSIHRSWNKRMPQ